MTQGKIADTTEAVDQLRARAETLAERLHSEAEAVRSGASLSERLVDNARQYASAKRAIAGALGLDLDATFDQLYREVERREAQSVQALRESLVGRLGALTAPSREYAVALDKFRERLAGAGPPVSLAALEQLVGAVDSEQPTALADLKQLCLSEDLPLLLAMGIHMGDIAGTDTALSPPPPEPALPRHDAHNDRTDVQPHDLDAQMPRPADMQPPGAPVTAPAVDDTSASDELNDAPTRSDMTGPGPRNQEADSVAATPADVRERDASEAAREPDRPSGATEESELVVVETSTVSPPAAAIQSPSAPAHDSDFDSALAEVLQAGRPDVAYWIAAAAEARGHVAPIASAALKAALLAPFARAAEPGFVAAIDDALTELVNAENLSHASVLAGCAGALLTAIVSPYGPGPRMLSTHGRRLGGGLADLFEVVGERAPRGELQVAARRDASAELDRRLEDLADESRQLRERLGEVTTSYVPTVRVWRTLLDGPLAVVFLVAEGRGNLEELRQLMTELGDRRQIEKLIDAQYFARRRVVRDGLTSRARDWLRGHINEVVAFGTRAVELRTHAAERDDGGMSSDAWVRDRVRALAEDATATIDEWTQTPAAAEAAAGKLLADAWQRFRAVVLEGEVRPPAWVPDDPGQPLAFGLADAYELRIDERYATAAEPEATIAPLLEAARASRARHDVVIARANLGEFHMAELLIATDVGHEPLREEVQSKRRAFRSAVQEHVTTVSHALTKAAREQVISDEDHRSLAAELELVDLDAPDLRGQRLLLDHVLETIESGQQARREDIRLELRELDADPVASADVERLLADGQIAVATDRVARLRAGDRVAAPTAEPSVLRQFLDFLSDKLDLKSLHDKVKHRDPAAATAIGYLRAAPGAKRLKPDHVTQVARHALTAAGFDVVTSGLARQPRERVHVLSLELAEVSSAPIPAFGSGLRHAAAVVVNNRPGDDLVGFLTDKAVLQAGSTPFLVLLNPLKRSARSELATSAREANRTFLLIDGYLLAFAALTDRPRLQTVFAATLPYTWSNPYVTHGVVPPEMFFGRTDEFETLIDPARSAFIFGGRQLGKSALLNRAVAETHHPSEDQITLLIDLEAKRVAHGGRTDVLWGHIAAELKRVTGDSIGGTRPDVIDWTRDWLETRPSAQLRILLDETDRFLEMDSRPDEGRDAFANLAAFRELMSRSDGRFKVVFAGLHSVQRFLGLPNQPFAHLGAPIPIGPLKWDDARELVERPTRSLGLEFDDYVVDRMLMLSGRHPSLLQHLCRAMVDHMRRKRGAGVPIRVSNGDLDMVYEDKGLRQELRRRFDWTLDLDLRYRALAYTLAHRSLDDPDVRRNGLSVTGLHEEVAEWWPTTFGDMQPDVVRALCDEMVSLLVFAQHEGRYRLWSTNVLQLLGTSEEISEGLVSKDPSSSSSIYEPQAYRRTVTASDLARSPLTFGDERIVLSDDGTRVSVVVGSELCGIDRVIEGLSECASEPDWPDVELKVHRKVPPPRDVAGGGALRAVHIAPVVGIDDYSWLKQRLVELRDALAGGNSRLTLVLNPATIDWWPQLAEDVAIGELDEDVTLLSLKRWDRRALRVWLDETQLPSADETERDAVYALTGGWPLFVEEFGALAIHHQRDIARCLDDMRARPTDRDRALKLLGIAGQPLLETCAQQLASFSEGGGGSLTDLADFAEIGVDHALRARDTFELLDALTGGSDDLSLEPALARHLLG